MASFHTELSREGPGLLLRDILSGTDEQVQAVIEAISEIDADIIALQSIDYDLEGRALQALGQDALNYKYYYSAPPNAGRATELDLDGDGRRGGPGDAQGYGTFYGQSGLAILSRFPIETSAVQNFTGLLWKDLPDALLPMTQKGPYPSAEAQNHQRLASKNALAVPIRHPNFGVITILTFHATPPVFDGPEDRNGRRNHDEVAFWLHFLNGAIGIAPRGKFILAGNANLDPKRGEGRKQALHNLLSHPLLQDPLKYQTTVHWKKLGDMRVDYLLPSRDWRVVRAQVAALHPAASRHRLIWVDLEHERLQP
ncbi:MAG: endonuclease/exonuclease/phosphatase family protein [Pseudomonadota bacterium]